MTRTDFEAAPEKPGHLKVRLFFKTWAPKHVRSYVMKSQADAAPPYIEDISVFVPAPLAYNRLSAYRGIFNRLVEAGLLGKRDVLEAFEFREEDAHTLAYFEKD